MTSSINARLLSEFVNVMQNELSCVDNHPFFAMFKIVHDKFKSEAMSKDQANVEIQRILSLTDEWHQHSRSWFHGQMGWMSCLSTTLDQFRMAADEISGFKDLDRYVREDLEVLIFVEEFV